MKKSQSTNTYAFFLEYFVYLYMRNLHNGENITLIPNIKMAQKEKKIRYFVLLLMLCFCFSLEFFLSVRRIRSVDPSVWPVIFIKGKC